MGEPIAIFPKPGEELHWEVKLHILQAIRPEIVLRMRAPGNWYVEGLAAEIRVDRHGLLGLVGNGLSPSKAVEDLWTKACEGQTLLFDYGSAHVRRVQWTGYIWKDVS